MWSANHERLNRVQNKLSEANRELKDAKQEIKTLKAMQRRQAKALDSTTGADAELPRKLRYVSTTTPTQHSPLPSPSFVILLLILRCK